MLEQSTTITSPSSVFDQLVLDHLRVAHLKGRLIVNRTAFAATALRQNWITAEDAVSLIDEAGLLTIVFGSSA